MFIERYYFFITLFQKHKDYRKILFISIERNSNFHRINEEIIDVERKTEAAHQRCVLVKGCSENVLQNDRRTPMLKCDFNKTAFGTLLKSHFRMGVLL